MNITHKSIIKNIFIKKAILFVDLSLSLSISNFSLLIKNILNIPFSSSEYFMEFIPNYYHPKPGNIMRSHQDHCSNLLIGFWNCKN